MTQIATIEAAANADGSTGWNLMIGIESFGLIAPAFEQCAELLADPLTILCGSTAAICTADETAGGYRVNGRWQFVSGCNNGQVFAGLVQRRRNGEPIEGLPRGLRGGDAPRFRSARHLERRWACPVPDRTTSPSPTSKCPTSAFWRRWVGTATIRRSNTFPLGSRLAYNKVGVALGIARAAIDAFVDIATGKVPRFTSRTLRDRPFAQRAIARAEVRLRAGRALVFELLEAMWAKVCAAEKVTTRDRALFQIACSDAVVGCAEAVDAVCRSRRHDRQRPHRAARTPHARHSRDSPARHRRAAAHRRRRTRAARPRTRRRDAQRILRWNCI